MGSDEKIWFHKVWAETNARLNRLSERVAENRDVMDSLDFARWLFWSGILELLEANASDGPLKVDGANLRWKCTELQRRCQERFALNDKEPRLEALQLQSIHEKLNTIAGYLAKTVISTGQAGNELKVISGGLDSSQPVLEKVQSA